MPDFTPKVGDMVQIEFLVPTTKSAALRVKKTGNIELDIRGVNKVMLVGFVGARDLQMETCDVHVASWPSQLVVPLSFPDIYWDDEVKSWFPKTTIDAEVEPAEDAAIALTEV